MSGSKVSTVVLGSIGGGTPVTAGVYYSTRSTVSSYIYWDSLPFDKRLYEWEYLEDDLKKDNGELHEGLEAVKDSLDSNAVSRSTESDDVEGKVYKGDALRLWCESIFKTVVKSLIQSEDVSLLESAKKYCVYPIKKKLEKEWKDSYLKVEGKQDDSKFMTRYSSLRALETTSGLDSTLRGLYQKAQRKEISDEEGAQAIKEWCKVAYDRGFKGKDSRMWNLVEDHCVGSTSTKIY